MKTGTWYEDVSKFLNCSLGELIEKVNELYRDVTVLMEHPEEAIIKWIPGDLDFTVVTSYNPDLVHIFPLNGETC